MKNKLPKNWIVVNSTSHPDKVYYFNIKTNKSSWSEPKEEPDESDKPMLRKRKKTNSDEILPTSPGDPNVVENEQNVTRKKLHAKRMSRTAPPNETPQMRAIREKILEKRLKSIPKNRDSNVKSQETSKNTKDAFVSKKPVPCSEGETSTKKTLTPEMQAIRDKIQQRKLNATASKKGKVKDIVDSVDKTVDKNNGMPEREQKDQATLRRRPNTRSSSTRDSSLGSGVSETMPTSTAIVDSSKKNEEQAKFDTSKVAPSNQEKRRSISKKVTYDSCNRSFITQKSPEKSNLKSVLTSPITRKRKINLAQERMENLRHSLSSECDDLENSLRAKRQNRSNRISLPMEHDEDISPPNVYENSEMRYRRLQVRLSKLKALQNNKTGNSNNSRDKIDDEKSSENPTGEKLVRQCVEEQNDEEMDWEPMGNETITHEVQAVRMQLCSDGLQRPIDYVPENILTVPLETPEEDKRLYIVVDTNVFLTDVKVVEEAKDVKFQNYGYPFIMIPWTVICELDYIKDNKSLSKSKSLQTKAREAIRFINRYFNSRHPRVVGQTPEDVKRNKEKFAVSCPDDEILQTCLQIRSQGNSVVLLSYDTNLCNKAMIYDLTTLGHGDPFEKIDYLHASENDRSLSNTSALQLDSESENKQISTLEEELLLADEIFMDLKVIMKDFLSEIVMKELENLFGENWERHTPIKPPYTLITVFKSAIKHWIAAVSESFIRKAEPVLKELLEAFYKFPDSGKKLKDVACILERCNDLVQMVLVDKHPDLTVSTSNSLDELAGRCLQYEKRLAQRRLKNMLGLEENANVQNERAEKAFRYFESTYAYARDMGGLAAEIVQMPTSFLYKKIDPLPSIDYVKQLQPELAANVNRLLHSLSASLDQVNDSCIDTRTLNNLYQALITFLPDRPTDNINLTLTDVYCCLTKKNEMLKAGIGQLQELSTHFCRLASYRCT